MNDLEDQTTFELIEYLADRIGPKFLGIGIEWEELIMLTSSDDGTVSRSSAVEFERGSTTRALFEELERRFCLKGAAHE